MDFLTIVLASVVILYLWYRQTYHRMVSMAAKLPGPTPLPILGNALHFFGKSPPQLLQVLEGFYRDFSSNKLACMRVGLHPMILLTHPTTVEAVLGSQKFLEKSSEYKPIMRWLATGLLTSTGQKWFARRKVITPAFHFKILEQFVEIFDKNSKILIEKLAEKKDQSADIFPLVTLCALDVICDTLRDLDDDSITSSVSKLLNFTHVETSLGVQVNAQIKSDSIYVQAVKDITEIFASRNFDVLKRSDFIYQFTAQSRRERATLKILHDFTDNVIKARRRELELMSSSSASSKSNEEDDIGSKRKLALLDILLQSTIDGKPLTDLDIREEVDTFVFEGHDTTTSGIAFCLYNLAKHPKAQAKCMEEIRSVIGDDIEGSVTLQDLNELKYLELCIKESLRLFPSVPFFGRKLNEDVEINGFVLPAGANIGVGPYFMGRDEKIWKNAGDFLPERFDSPDEKIHPYAHVAFSAGPRNCIGQKFAMLEMKSTISKTLRRFELLPAPGYKPILVADLILRPENGIELILKDRKY